VGRLFEFSKNNYTLFYYEHQNQFNMGNKRLLSHKTYIAVAQN